MLASATNICSTLNDIPCIGDGDTGYGNAVNVKRTVKGYAQVQQYGSARDGCDHVPKKKTNQCSE